MLSLIIDKIHNLLGNVLDLAHQPFSPVLGLLVSAIVSGIILVIIYGKVSSQKKIASAKRSIYANLLESVLFRHDTGLSLKAQLKMFLGGLRYFLLAIPPILILMIPTIFLLAQLNLRYASTPLQTGQETILAVQLDAPEINSYSLSFPEGVIASKPVREATEKEISWKLRFFESGEKTIKINNNAGQEIFSQRIPVNSKASIQAAEGGKSSLSKLLYPQAKTTTFTDVLTRYTIKLPEAQFLFLGINWNWLALFFLVSLLSGLLAAKILKIEV